MVNIEEKNEEDQNPRKKVIKKQPISSFIQKGFDKLPEYTKKNLTQTLIQN